VRHSDYNHCTTEPAPPATRVGDPESPLTSFVDCSVAAKLPQPQAEKIFRFSLNSLIFC
jgi:hypothetical protein